MRVLTVDDTRTTRLIVRKCFEELGYTVLEAVHGQAALDTLAQQGPVDFMILDWNMPIMDGYTCLEEVRKRAEYNGIKIVVCTTVSQKTEVMRAIRAGANGYVLKPANAERLIEAVAKALGVSQLPKLKKDVAPAPSSDLAENAHIRAVTNTLRELFQGYMNQPVRIGEPKVNGGASLPLNGVSGVVTFSGGVDGQFVITFPVAVAQKCAQDYTREKLLPEVVVQETIRDIATIMMQRASTIGGTQNVKISSPTVVEGADYVIRPPGGSITTVVPCGCSHGDFAVHLSIADQAN